MPSSPRRIVKARRHSNQRGIHNWTIGIPADIARALDASGIDQFMVELTEEGMLYRPLAMAPDLELPSWLVDEGAGGKP